MAVHLDPPLAKASLSFYGQFPIPDSPLSLRCSWSLPPPTLTISGAEGVKQSKINGEYFELPTHGLGHASVYRQKGGEYWLYYVPPMKQWHIGLSHGAKGPNGPVPNGFIYSDPAIPGSCPSDARGWRGNRTSQASLVVTRLPSVEISHSSFCRLSEPDARNRSGSSTSAVRHSKTSKDRADRRSGGESYTFGDLTRSGLRKLLAGGEGPSWRHSASRIWGDDSYKLGDVTRTGLAKFQGGWRDRTDRSWGDDAYKFGDFARSGFVRLRDAQRSSQRAQEAANREMEAVQEAAKAQRQADELERSLCSSLGDACAPESFRST